MRTYLLALLFIVAAGMTWGCANTKSGSPVATQAADTAGVKAWVMRSGEADLLKLTTPIDFRCVMGDGTLHFDTGKYEVKIWLVPQVQTVDEAVEHVSTQIINEFKDFKPDHTTELTVAGSPAKRLVGVGHEADDGDPGDADIIVFKVGGHVFVACYHGETLTPVGQQGMLTLVQSAQVP